MCNLAAWGTGTRSASSSALGASIGVAATGAAAPCARRGSSSQRRRPSRSDSCSASGTRLPAAQPARSAARSGRRPSSRHASARRHPRRHRPVAHARLARRRGARVRPGARVPRGSRSAGARRTPALPCAGAPRRAPIACPRLTQAKPKPVVLVIVDGLTPSVFEAADTPALRFLAEHGEYRRAVSTFPSLTPVCLSLDRNRHASRPAPHPAPRLVASRRAASRRIRLVVRRGPRRRGHALAARHDRRSEREAPLARRRDRLRDARGRRADDGRDQHHVLPRPHAPPGDDPRRAGGVRPEAVLLVLALRERPHGRADRRAQPRTRLDRRLRRVGRPLARHARRFRPARLLPAGLRLRVACGRAGQLARGARALATPRSARSSMPRAGRTRSSSATP